MFDLDRLDYREFETLVGLLLRREGHQIVHGPGAPGTRGPDFETISPEGRPVVVEVKHIKFGGGVGRSVVRQFSGDIERYRQQNDGVQGLLVVSTALSTAAIEEITHEADIAVWDLQTLSLRLAQQQDLQSIFESAIDSKRLFDSRVESLVGGLVSRADEL